MPFSRSTALFLALTALTLAARGATAQSFDPVTFDFSRGTQDWLPFYVIGEQEDTSHYVIEDLGIGIGPNSSGVFGFWGTDDPIDGGRFIGGTIVDVEWVVTSSAESPEDVPDFRLRLTANDGSSTQDYLIQDAFFMDSHPSGTVPTGLMSKTFRTLHWVPNSVVNNLPPLSRPGYFAAFDVLEFKGNNPARFANATILESVNFSSFEPNPAGGTETVLENFLNSSSGRAGWDQSERDIAGIPVRHRTSDEFGIGIQTMGVATSSEISFGWWFLNRAFLVEPDSIYRIEWTVQTIAEDGLSESADAVNTRLRVQDSHLDFVASAITGALPDSEDITNNPSPNGTSFVAYMAFPEALVGERMNVFFDVWQDNRQDRRSDITMYLREFRVIRENAPDRDTKTQLSSWTVEETAP